MNLTQKSIAIIKSYQSENGAYVACPNFPTYHYCWLRDGAFIAYSMDVMNEHESSRKFYEWVHATIVKHRPKATRALKKYESGAHIYPGELLHTRYTLDGDEGQEDWPNYQLDGYGTWLWGLAEHIRCTGNVQLVESFRESIDLTLAYIKAFWKHPNYDCWEEFGDKVHTATLACLYGGVKGINALLNDDELNTLLAEMKQFITDHCVTDGRLVKFVGSTNVDASLLWTAVPFDLFAANDEVMVQTVREIENALLHGGGVHRYPEDTYYGGGLWILLAAWLGWYYAKTGDLEKAKQQRAWIEQQQTDDHELPEQVNSHMNDETYYDRWVNKWGEIATPLLWSHAMYLVLLKNIETCEESRYESKAGHR